MRGLIFAVLMLSGLAAHSGDFAQPMIIGVTSTVTVQGITISSSPATDVVISTMALYRQVCVQNLDTSAFIACGDTVNVSTIQASGLMGVYLTTATATSLATYPPCFELVPGKRFWCASAESNATSRAVIIRKR